MVQRLSLMGIVSDEERTMAVRSLEALSGMQPRAFETEREVWEPKHRYRPGQGQTSQVEQYRLFLVRSTFGTKSSDAKPSDVKSPDAEPSDAEPSDAESSDAKASDAESPGGSAPASLAIEAREVPEAGRNTKVISQSVLVSRFHSCAQDAKPFLEDIGYEPRSKHSLRGLEFVLRKHVVVQLYQLHAADGALLDASRQHVVEARVDVDAVTDLAAVEQATQLLLATQQELRGIVALKAPGRGAFNTRMPRLGAV